MKKMATTLVAGALALSMALMGCSGTQTETSTEEEQVVAESAEFVNGGWSVVEEVSPQLTEEEEALFHQVREGLVGVSYTPVRVLATQQVAGTNYAYLCQGTTATADPVTSWFVVVIYRDLEKAAQILSITEIDLADVQIAVDEDDEDIVGGWEVVESTDTEFVPVEAQTAFDKAYETYVGVDLHPLATLGSQVVAGTNYLILCEGLPLRTGAKPQLYVAGVYADLDGNAEFTGVESFSLLSYVDVTE